MRVVIGADYMPTALEKKDSIILVNNLKQDLMRVFNEADYRVLNLEAPVTEKDTPILKCGKSVKISPETLAILDRLQVDLVSLANNHILDQGQMGLKNTKYELDKHHIGYIGLIKTTKTDAEPMILNDKAQDISVGIYCCCEHEFSVATETSAGAVAYDDIYTLQCLNRIKEKCDYIIVLYHGGKEYYPYPTPELQKRCREMINAGADVVLAQHSHCVGCEEKYRGKTIVYGQGDFYTNSIHQKENESLLTVIDFFEGVHIDYIPVISDKQNIYLARGSRARAVLDGFRKRSEEIKKAEFVAAKYNGLVKASQDYYLKQIYLPDSFIFRMFNKLSGYRIEKIIIKRLIKKNKLLRLRNIVECETHRELLLSILKL